MSSKKKQTRLEYILEAVDRFSAPMKKFNKRIDDSFRGIKKLKKASANLKRESGWNKLAFRAGQLRSRLGGVVQEAKALAAQASAIVIGAAGGLLAVVNSTAQAGDRIAKDALRLGLSTTALQEFEYAAEHSGIAFTTFGMAFQRFGRRVGEAFMGKGEAKDALKQLGIQLTDVNGKLRPSEELFMDVAEALSRIENPSIRNALAMKLFDSEGVKLVQMLEGGKEGLAALRKEAHLYGSIISGPTTKASEAYIKATTELKKAFSGVRNIIGEELMPTVTYLAQRLTSFVVENQGQIREWVHQFAVSLPNAFKRLRDGVSELRAKLEPLFGFIGALSDRFGGVNVALTALAIVIGGKLALSVAALVPVLYSLSAAMLTTPIGWFIMGVTALIGLPVLIVKNWKPISEFFANMWARIKHDFLDVVDTIASGFSAVADWLPDWVTGRDDSVKPLDRKWKTGEDSHPILGAANVTRSIRETRSLTQQQSTEKKESTVKVQFENMPKGTRVSQHGGTDVDMDMGYSMAGY